MAKNHREFGFLPPNDKSNPLCRNEEMKFEKALDSYIKNLDNKDDMKEHEIDLINDLIYNSDEDNIGSDIGNKSKENLNLYSKDKQELIEKFKVGKK